MSEEQNQSNLCNIYSIQVNVSAKLGKNIIIIFGYLILINDIINNINQEGTDSNYRSFFYY
jgi:hypothetical protein